MSHMNSRAVLDAANFGSTAALWSRIDAGTFPRPVAMSARGDYQWDAEAVIRAIAIHRAPGPDEPLVKPSEPKKREKPTPEKTVTRERKDPKQTETRTSE